MCHERLRLRGQSKKSESWAVHLLIRWLFLLFYSNNMHKWWIKVWFLTCQMPVLSGRTNFDPFLKTWKFFTPKFPMKYSKNGQNFTTPKNTWNVIFETCWTPCKKPHFSMWPRSRNTFFWLTPYHVKGAYHDRKWPWYDKKWVKNCQNWIISSLKQYNLNIYKNTAVNTRFFL